MGMMTRVDRRSFLGALAVLPLAGCSEQIEPTTQNTGERQPQAPPPLPTAKAPDELTELVKLDPSIKLDMPYATAENIAGRQLYNEPRAFLLHFVAEALISAHQKAAQDGFGLTIYDAYRPWRVTKALWDATPPGPKRNYVANPKKGSRHNRGCAVDLTLHRLSDGEQVEMPSRFDDLSARAHRSYGDDSPAARRHAQALESYLEPLGFIGMSNEWWHFDHRDWAKYPILDIPLTKL